MRKPIALVLCGGSGERMKPWSLKRHKALFKIEGGQTIVGRHVEKLRPYCERVVVICPRARRTEFNPVPAHVECERTLTGTGSKLLRVARRWPGRDLIVAYGDVWYSDQMYERMLTHLAHCENSIKLATELVPEERREWRGLVQTRFRKVIEVLRSPYRTLPDGTAFHAALDCFGRKALTHLTRKLHGESLDLMDDVVRRALTDGLYVEAVHFDAKPGVLSSDLGTPERFAKYCMRRYIGEIREGAVEAALAVLKARRILTCGNGGSAHNAFHAALDWSKVGNKHAESLGEAGELSAHSNDDGFSVALANMLASRRLAKGDLLVCFSASGNSANVCWAAEAARSRGAKVVALTQASKCEIEKHSHICVRALQSLDGSPWSYGRIEDEAARWMHATTALLHGLQA